MDVELNASSVYIHKDQDVFKTAVSKAFANAHRTFVSQ
jgi:hypothetical protein